MAMAGEHKGKRWYVKAGEPGQSDLYGFLPRWSRRAGVHWECEMKRPGETPTYDQTVWLRQCNEVTEAAFWVDNAETFRRVMQAICDGARVVYPRFDDGAGVDFRVPVPGNRTRTIVICGPSYEYNLI